MSDASILVVDDEALVTSALTRAIQRLGHRVLAVNDPRDVLELMSRESIDLMITDKDMPPMSGHVLLGRVRAAHPEVPCIMLTGVPSLESALEAINTDQVFRYLTKPWAPQALEDTIAVGLDRRAMLVLAAAARRAEGERAAALAELHARDPELRGLPAGSVELAASPVSEQLDDVVRRYLASDAAVAMAAAGLAGMVAQARPAHIAEALAILAVRNPTAGAVLTPLPAARHSRLDVDVRGTMFPLMMLPAAVADQLAARLAVHAGIDPSTTSERLGRFTAHVPGASGQLVVSYRRTDGGAALELRRVLLGADAPAISASQQYGAYVLLDKIGQGGLGTVYRALHTALERPAAVKVLRGAYADDPITVARFVREARAATRARHPRIVETFDFGHTSDGRPYMAMELVESPTLFQRLRRGPIDPLEAVLIARDIAEGLAAAHRVDVIHRDLKPANIFVDDRMAVKICDFGAAKILDVGDDDLTRTGMTLGTPTYMSPEHITGKPLDGRTDLYALGCVLFEMLSGKAPYRGEIRAVLNQHLQADVPEPEAPDGPVPAGLVRVVKKAMAKDRRQRHASADAMMADLDFIAEELSRARGARRT